MGAVTSAPVGKRVQRESHSPRPRGTLPWHHLALVGALSLAILALVLRLWNIDRESLWLDEGYTLLFSRLPLDRLLLVGGAHEHPPLYYLLVHTGLAVRDSYLVPRIISAIAGSLSVLVLYALGAKLFNRGTGLIAAALLTISPFHLWYSEDARAYELAGLLVLLSYLLLLTALDCPRKRYWLLYAVCTAGALYSEYTTVLVLLPQGLLFLPARRTGLHTSLLRAWLAAALLFAPWVVTLILDVRSIASNYWIPAPTVDSVVSTVLDFLNLNTPCPAPPCTGHLAPLPFLAGHELLVAGCTAIIVGGALILALVRRDVRLSLLMLWLVLPFAVILVIAIRRSLYLDRVFLDATFALYLLLGAAAMRLRREWWPGLPAVMALTIVFLGGLANFQPLYAQPVNPDWRSGTRDFGAAYRPGQVVIYNPGTLRSLVGAYLPRGWHATRESPFWSHTYLDVPGWQRRFAAVTEKALRDTSLPLKERYKRLDRVLLNRELKEATSGLRQAWLVTEDYPGISDTRHWFAAHGFYLMLSEIYRGNVRIELWDRSPPTLFGPAIVPDDGFGRQWTRSGRTTVSAGVAHEDGQASFTRSFRVVDGAAYVVNVEYRAIPPASPSIQVRTFDRSGHVVGGIVNRFGQSIDYFPRTEWYDMPVNGVWLSQPFGFVAPPGAVRATLDVRTRFGRTSWRHVAVYREPN